MSKVLIGIVGKPDNTSDMWSYIMINDEIKQMINKNNALAIGIMPQDTKFKRNGDNVYSLSKEEKEDLKTILEKVDGVILQGGIVNNSYEQEIVQICLNQNKPLLCICGGFNNMVKALGGNLVEHSEFHNKYGEEEAHKVVLNKDSYLYHILKKEDFMVNSIHNLIATSTSIKNCKITGICPMDNTVEAIEVPNKKFAIGIKWHPELMQNNDLMNQLFQELINQCQKY